MVYIVPTTHLFLAFHIPISSVEFSTIVLDNVPGQVPGLPSIPKSTPLVDTKHSNLF